MVNEFELKYSPQFYNELDSIISYIGQVLENRVAANNLLDKMERKKRESKKSIRI